MVSEWVVTTNGVKRTCTCTSAIWFGRDEPLIRDYIRAVEALCQAMPLESVSFYQIGQPFHFNYTIDALDGRKWRQDIEFASAQDFDPGMKFNVTDYWKLSEFALHREIRNYLVEMHARLGASSVIVTYEPT